MNISLKTFRKISKFFAVCALFVCMLSFVVKAGDLIEIRNGVKTTYEEKPRPLVDTLNMNYDLRWILDRKGNWKLNIRRINGRLIDISNCWVRVGNTVTIDGKREVVHDFYYFDINGYMVTGWYVDSLKNYYYLCMDDSTERGKLMRGWCKIGDDHYYFDNDGILQRNIITPDGFFIDEYGRWR